jgi:hypothetical protein
VSTFAADLAADLEADLAAGFGAALVTVLAMRVSSDKESMTAKTYKKYEFAHPLN